MKRKKQSAFLVFCVSAAALSFSLASCQPGTPSSTTPSSSTSSSTTSPSTSSSTSPAVELYEVTVEKTTHGTVTLSKTGKLKAGEKVEILAIPDAGYEVDTYYFNDKALEGNTFTVIAGENVVSVTFKELPPVQEYGTVRVLDDEVTGGTIEAFLEDGTKIGADNERLPVGTKVRLSFSPLNECYEIKEVFLNGEARALSEKVEFEVVKGKNFLSGTFALSHPGQGLIRLAKEVEHAEVTIQSLDTYVAVGTSVKITVEPDANYIVRAVSLNGTALAGVDGAYSFAVVEGLNTIAIALVASDYTQQSSVFDCALHILSVGSEPRIMTDFKMTYSEVFGGLQCFFMGDLECYIRGYVSNNYLRITFDNGRREWVNSIDLVMSHKQLRYLIHSMVVKARNSDSEEWTTLASPTQISWPIIGQSRRFFFVNNQPYNQYSFENFAGDDPVWNVYHLKLNAHPTGMAVPELAYPQHSMEIYQNIAIAEMYPLYDYYFDFDMNSTLPQDLGLDPYNGRISGIPRNLSSSHPYQIVAKKYTGELTSVTLSISVVLCYGGKSVITLAVMQDMYNAGYSYNLYGGKDTSGQLVSTIQSFMEVTQLYFVDYCLPHALYTLEIIDNNGGNAPNYNGYYLSVDFGALKFETGLIPYNAYSVTLHFSSYLPFQINLDDWQVEKFTDLTGKDWTAIDFDDSGWQRMKASAIGTSQLTTVYIRRSFEIPDLHDYTLLNVRIRYTGGIVAYFNGQKVARFNLEDDASSSQSSISIHDPNTFSIFHIIFSTTQAVVGKNVIAFEVHRPITYTSAKIITFDATGVFGVSDCSLALDSYVTMDSSLDDPLVVEQIFDFTPSRLYALESRAGAHIHWMVENMEGTRFNAYAWQVSSNNTGWGISLYARSSGSSGPSNDTEGYVKVFTGTDLSLKEMARTVYPTPLNLVPFDEFLFMVDVPLDRSTDVYSQSFLYCKASGTDSCSGIDEFPAVGNGSVSPAACPYGYAGYRYRECLNGQLSAIHDEFCELKAPKHLKYEASSFHFFIDASSSTGLPHYTNLIHQFSIYGGKQLPLGLALDPQSGEISGVPEVEWANETFVVLGENSKGSTFTRITIKVEQGYCEADSVFERTKAGECAVHVCGSQGKYMGMKKRKCEATTSGGKWSHTEGICVSIFSVVVLILLVVILGLLVVALLIRIRRTKKQGKKRRSRRKRIQRYCNDEFEMVHF